jgi:hypothetical protein
MKPERGKIYRLTDGNADSALVLLATNFDDEGDLQVVLLEDTTGYDRGDIIPVNDFDLSGPIAVKLTTYSPGGWPADDVYIAGAEAE